MLCARRSAFVSRLDGSEEFVQAGHLANEEDPIVLEHPGLFGPAEAGPPAPVVFRAEDEPAEVPVEDDPVVEDEPAEVEPMAEPESKPGTRKARAPRG